MDDNLVGYLLKALDADTQREVEAYLRANPEAFQHLDLLRRAMNPLTVDREHPPPPAGLRIRTLARVAEYRHRELPRLLPLPPSRPSPPRSRWRRADVLVAASLLLAFLGLLFPGVNYLWYQHNISSCQANLQTFYRAIMAYSDHHGGELPRVERNPNPPRDVAGIFVPILHEGGYLQSNGIVRCPASGSPSPPPVLSLQTLEQHTLRPEQWKQEAGRLAGCYAYSLGYQEGGQHYGLHFAYQEANNDHMPIMADRPPFDRQTYVTVPSDNSLNHGGKGQNVLYLSGRVVFFTKRTVGIGGDDIYVNQQNRIEAGVNRWDTVLGASGFHPYPSVAPND
jgi:hypothetical protein